MIKKVIYYTFKTLLVFIVLIAGIVALGKAYLEMSKYQGQN